MVRFVLTAHTQFLAYKLSSDQAASASNVTR